MNHYIKTIIIFLLSFPILGKAQAPPLQKSGTATIMVELEDAQPTDTLMLMYFENSLFNEATQNGDNVEMQRTTSNGTYQFNFPITGQTGYFFLAKKTSGRLRFSPLSELLKAEEGDDILLKIKDKNRTGPFNLLTKYSFSYSGRGNLKYNIRLKLDSILYWTKSTNIPIFSPTFKYNEGNSDKNRIEIAINYLEVNKNELNGYIYQLTKADLTFSNSSIFKLIKGKFNSLLDSDKEVFKNEYLQTIGKVNMHDFSDEILVRSKSAINYFLAQAQATILITGKMDDPHTLYNYLCTNYSGMVLDKLLVYYFVKANVSVAVRSSQLNDALKRVKMPNCLERLNQLKSRLQVSSLDKTYNLNDVYSKPVSLSDFRGKVVLVDFWFTGCLFCQKFVKEQLIKVEQAFKDNPDVVFVSISVDRDKNTWLNSVKQHVYTLPSSVNLNTASLGSNHPLIKMLNVQSYPSVLLLDSSGKAVTFGIANESTPNLYQADQIIAKIKSLL